MTLAINKMGGWHFSNTVRYEHLKGDMALPTEGVFNYLPVATIQSASVIKVSG